MGDRFLKLLLCIPLTVAPGFADGIGTINGGAGVLGPTFSQAPGFVAGVTIATPSTARHEIEGGAAINTVTYGGTTISIANGFLSLSPTAGSFDASTDTYTYTGGTWSITGSIPTLGIPDDTTLVNGAVAAIIAAFSGPSPSITFSTVDDTLDPILAGFLGISGTGWNDPGTIQLTDVTLGAGGSWEAVTFGADVPLTPVPEPASIVLLGTVLIAVAEAVRRRPQRQSK